jgi:hypothetical protein
MLGDHDSSGVSGANHPNPIADSSPAIRVGFIDIDGHRLPLWHGTMRSHSDLSAHPRGPLATLIGMPPKSLWPPGIDSFRDVSLNGYFVCWVDLQRKVSIAVYAVVADCSAQTEDQQNSRQIRMSS